MLWLLLLAAGFDDDLCFDAASGWRNCYPAPPEDLDCTPGPGKDGLDGKKSPCGEWAQKMYTDQVGQFPGRSTMHADATFLLAQIAGLTPAAAYWVAAYTEAVDQGVFRPRLTRPGDPHDGAVSDPELHSADLTGLNRFHLCAGASEFHYLVRSLPDDGTLALGDEDGKGSLAERLATQGYADGDAQLTQTREWALAKHDRPRLCINGLKEPKADAENWSEKWYAGDGSDQCYCSAPFEQKSWDSPGGPRCSAQSVKWDVSFLGYITWTLYTRSGDQPLSFKHTEKSNQKFDPMNLFWYQARLKKCPAQEYEDVVWADDLEQHLDRASGRFEGGPVPVELARFGIYMHQLQDAYSHHTCYDHSHMEGPEEGYFNIKYNKHPGFCKSTAHVLHHYWEFGFPDNWWATTRRAVEGTLLELGRFVDHWRADKPAWLRAPDTAETEAGRTAAPGPEAAPLDKAAAAEEVVAALEVMDPLRRVQALADVAEKHGLQSWDGMLRPEQAAAAPKTVRLEQAVDQAVDQAVEQAVVELPAQRSVRRAVAPDGAAAPL